MTYISKYATYLNGATRLALALALVCPFIEAQALQGRWDGTVKYGDSNIPFPIEFSQQGSDVTASFFNGDDRVTSTSGRLSGTTPTRAYSKAAGERPRLCGEEVRESTNPPRTPNRFRPATAPGNRVAIAYRRRLPTERSKRVQRGFPRRQQASFRTFPSAYYRGDPFSASRGKSSSRS